MNWKSEYKNFLLILGFFLFAYFMPIDSVLFKNSIIDAFALAKWYAKEHVLLCLVPAFFIVGAFMYFATLTEIPILQGLINNGIGKGPALALLLAGPALSLPNMLVIRSVIGIQKAVVYVSLVVIMATISRLIYGELC